MISEVYQTYISRFSTLTLGVDEPPHPEISLMICIPAINEPDILNTLESLAQCQAPGGKVEIILCVNAPEGVSEALLSQNSSTQKEAINWGKRRAPAFINLQVLCVEGLPKKHAGAGWARKIAMDVALARWAGLGVDGPIVCLDADCKVSPNYLVEILAAFNYPGVKLGHLEFCHRFELEDNPVLRQGIINYELHLRCHIAGLAWAGYPFAEHTVGSCMVVRATHYAKGGGMNRKKAGEDFYFMHKLLPLGGYVRIPATVYPSCRVSERVPFGTGRAQLDWVKGKPAEKLTYSVTVYKVLKSFFKDLSESFQVEKEINNKELKGFFEPGELESMLASFNSQSGNKEIYFRRLWQWMDGFRVLKLTHHLRDHGHPNAPVTKVAEELMNIGAFTGKEENRVDELLKGLR